MPELPEVEIMVRRLGAALTGGVVESALAKGVGTLKSFDPPLGELRGHTFTGMRRRSKLLIVGFDGDLLLLVHLMSAGRLQLYDKPGSLKDRTLRLAIRLTDGRELRLREFGTRQSTWAKLLRAADLEAEPNVAKLGPEAWPDPPPLEDLLDDARPLHSMLRDQRVLAGIGRSWADEILHTAKLSPFKRGNTLDAREADVLRASMVERLGAAIDHYEAVVGPTIPDKLPMPLTVHGRQGSPCPRCGTTLEAVFFEDYVVAYCPQCQTGGRLLKDRRLSRLLK
ncbi:MAG TPA: DNA-formamidopyrimidine glycosylase family protein [Acidimicrobiia bacterium]|nr:DNA-formamidopyrimidine glycosylase family protein [Acidimicrobiia bacterium]